MHQAEEDILVLAAQDGNLKAFTMIYQRYQKPLLRYAFRVCADTEIAQDAVQEAWITLANNIRKLEDPSTLRSWLYRLVRWRSIDLIRVTNRYKENEDIFEEDRYGDADERNTDQSDDLRLAINRLPLIEKQLIHLFYLDELKISEIATVLGIPEGTVKSRLNRARRLLKQRFDV